MNTISLKLKLLLSFLFISSLMLVQGAVNHSTQNEIIERFENVTEVESPKLALLGRMAHQMQEGQMLSEMLAIVKDSKTLDDVYKEIEGAITEFNETDVKFRTYQLSEAELKIYDPFIADWKKWVEAARQAIETRKAGSTLDAMGELIMGPVLEKHEVAEGHLSGLLEYYAKHSEFQRLEGMAAADRGTTLSLLMAGLGMLLAFGFGLFFSSGLSKRLNRITGQITESAGETASASSQLTGASQQLSTGAAESAAALEETVASLEELSSQVKNNSDNAREADLLSQKSKISAEKGEKEIAQLIEAMNRIAAGSKKISEIINVIDDIAFQTNLLALNASVEAARAGEHGKGFAVVADAVRNLAQRSATAAKDITRLIQENVSQSEAGAKIASTSGVVLNEIVTNVKKVSDLNQEISMASQQQSSGIQQISQAMNDLDRSTQSNAASSEEVASNSSLMTEQARQLSSLALELQAIIDGRQIKSKPVPAEESAGTFQKHKARPQFSKSKAA